MLYHGCSNRKRERITSYIVASLFLFSQSQLSQLNIISIFSNKGALQATTDSVC